MPDLDGVIHAVGIVVCSMDYRNTTVVKVETTLIDLRTLYSLKSQSRSSQKEEADHKLSTVDEFQVLTDEKETMRAVS